MWPSFKDGDMIVCESYTNQNISVGDIVVFTHPFKQNVTCVKRVLEIKNSKIFVEGDNPDPLASEDSHNFGLIQTRSISAIAKVDPEGLEPTTARL